MKPSDDDRFNIELLKLLAQVAWGDDTLDLAETQALESLGRSWFVPEVELHVLVETLKTGKRLPPPNLGLLRKHPDAAMEAVRALTAVDNRLADDEKLLIEQVKDLLRGS